MLANKRRADALPQNYLWLLLQKSPVLRQHLFLLQPPCLSKCRPNCPCAVLAVFLQAKTKLCYNLNSVPDKEKAITSELSDWQYIPVHQNQTNGGKLVLYFWFSNKYRFFFGKVGIWSLLTLRDYQKVIGFLAHTAIQSRHLRSTISTHHISNITS